MHPYLQEDDDGISFWCPGCASLDPNEGMHFFRLVSDDIDQRWEFDGNSSFEPSLAYEKPQCHLHLTAGEIRYYPDCEHELAGKTIPLGPIP